MLISRVKRIVNAFHVSYRTTWEKSQKGSKEMERGRYMEQQIKTEAGVSKNI